MSKEYTYKIVVGGVGGEISAGTVERATYDYFKEHEIDIDDYCNDYDNEQNVPEEHQFVNPGSFYECYDFGHETGCEFESSQEIEIYDENNDLVWSQKLDYQALRGDGVAVTEAIHFDRNDEPDGTCVFVGRSIEKGLFIECMITTKSLLDPSKLTLSIDTIDGWSLLTYITYDGEELENQGADTVCKALEYELFMIGE